MRTLFGRAGVLWSLAIAMVLSGACVRAEDAAVAPPPLIRLVGEEWCPHTCGGTQPQPGYMVEIVQEVLRELGHDSDFTATHWARALRDTRAGRFDLLIGIGRNDAADFRLTRQVFALSEFCVYTAADSSWQYDGLASLATQRLGVPTGYSFDAPMAQYLASNQCSARVQMVADERPLRVLLERLQHDRIDAFIASEASLRFYLQGDPVFGLIRKAGCLEYRQPFFVAAASSNVLTLRLIDELDKGIERLRDSGRLKIILDRYQVIDWQDAIPAGR